MKFIKVLVIPIFMVLPCFAMVPKTTVARLLSARIPIKVKKLSPRIEKQFKDMRVAHLKDPFLRELNYGAINRVAYSSSGLSEKFFQKYTQDGKSIAANVLINIRHDFIGEIKKGRVSIPPLEMQCEKEQAVWVPKWDRKPWRNYFDEEFYEQLCSFMHRRLKTWEQEYALTGIITELGNHYDEAVDYVLRDKNNYSQESALALTHYIWAIKKFDAEFSYPSEASMPATLAEKFQKRSSGIQQLLAMRDWQKSPDVMAYCEYCVKDKKKQSLKL